MEKNKFTWLAADTYARSKNGQGGSRIENGKQYDAAAFDPEVVAEWVRAGAAEYTGGKKPAEIKAT
jgi:phage terminase Nu1 subunit (DNA packaging protein)